MMAGQIFRLIAAVLTGLLAGAVLSALSAAPAQLDQRTFDLPAGRLFQFVLAASDASWELRKVNESIRFAEARNVLTGARLTVEGSRVQLQHSGTKSGRLIMVSG